MSCMPGGSGSCSTSDACVQVCLESVASVMIDTSVYGFGIMLLAVFCSRMMRLN